MDYHFKSQVTAFDCWKSTMRHTYHSIVGVCNLVFTGAMFALAFVYLGKVKPLETMLILLGCLWFTIIQPTGIFLQYRKRLADIPQDMELGFNTQGMHVMTGGKQEDIPWKKLARIAVEPGMVILYSDAKHGYILTNQNMGQERNAFLAFIKQQTKNK
ncbi:MAG: YcxB family protein [Eubacterium sp.]|nr:YcxB family protein [Eubacterium sp.]